MKIRRSFTQVLLLTVFFVHPQMASGAPPQSSSNKPAAEKQTLTLTGMVSENGSLLLTAADQKLYHVLNSETLRHLEGQLVTLRAKYLAEKRQLYVTAVRAESAPQPDKLFHTSDAAFRR